MRQSAPLLNLLVCLCVGLWLCLTGLGARLARGLRLGGMNARRGGFYVYRLASSDRSGWPLSSGGAVPMRARRSKRRC